MQTKTFYIAVQNESMESEGTVLHTQCGETTQLLVSKSCARDSCSIRRMIRNVFNINEVQIVKLRNEHGSLVPINAKLLSSSSLYTLEVMDRHSSVEATPRTISLPKYDESLRDNLHYLIERLSRLEDSLTDLQSRRDEKIKQEMNDLDQTLSFLDRRFLDADQLPWCGMFNKYPLW